MKHVISSTVALLLALLLLITPNGVVCNEDAPASKEAQMKMQAYKDNSTFILRHFPEANKMLQGNSFFDTISSKPMFVAEGEYNAELGGNFLLLYQIFNIEALGIQLASVSKATVLANKDAVSATLNYAAGKLYALISRDNKSYALLISTLPRNEGFKHASLIESRILLLGQESVFADKDIEVGSLEFHKNGEHTVLTNTPQWKELSENLKNKLNGIIMGKSVRPMSLIYHRSHNEIEMILPVELESKDYAVQIVKMWVNPKAICIEICAKLLPGNSYERSSGTVGGRQMRDVTIHAPDFLPFEPTEPGEPRTPPADESAPSGENNSTPPASNETPLARDTSVPSSSSHDSAQPTSAVAEARPFPWAIVIVVAIAALALGAITTLLLTRAKKTAK